MCPIPEGTVDALTLLQAKGMLDSRRYPRNSCMGIRDYSPPSPRCRRRSSLGHHSKQFRSLSGWHAWFSEPQTCILRDNLRSSAAHLTLSNSPIQQIEYSQRRRPPSTSSALGDLGQAKPGSSSRPASCCREKRSAGTPLMRMWGCRRPCPATSTSKSYQRVPFRRSRLGDKVSGTGGCNMNAGYRRSTKT